MDTCDECCPFSNCLRILLINVALLTVAVSAVFAQSPDQPLKGPWLDKSLSPDKRADLLIEQMRNGAQSAEHSALPDCCHGLVDRLALPNRGQPAASGHDHLRSSRWQLTFWGRMIFSENRFHFPDSALADVASAREGGANALPSRALWPQSADGAARLMGRRPWRTGTFAVDESRG